MQKSKLIDLVTHHMSHLSVQTITNGVNEIIDAMSETLAKGDRIEIRGFGSFSLHFHGPRQAHNPKTGKRLIAAAKYRPHFKPGKELREQVNKLK